MGRQPLFLVFVGFEAWPPVCIYLIQKDDRKVPHDSSLGSILRPHGLDCRGWDHLWLRVLRVAWFRIGIYKCNLTGLLSRGLIYIMYHDHMDATNPRNEELQTSYDQKRGVWKQTLTTRGPQERLRALRGIQRQSGPRRRLSVSAFQAPFLGKLVNIHADGDGAALAQ